VSERNEEKTDESNAGKADRRDSQRERPEPNRCSGVTGDRDRRERKKSQGRDARPYDNESAHSRPFAYDNDTPYKYVNSGDVLVYFSSCLCLYV